MNTLEKAFGIAQALNGLTCWVYVTADDVLKKATPAEIDFYYSKICTNQR